MEPHFDETRLRADFALKDLRARECLIREIKGVWHRKELIELLFLLLMILVMYWATRREWTAANGILLLITSATIAYGIIGVHRRIDALIKLLELDGFLKTHK